MKWTAEADLVVGLAVGSGKRKLGVGFGIGRRKIIKNLGLDLEAQLLKRCCLFVLKDSTVLTLNWSVDKSKSIYLDQGKAMKRSNVFNLLLQMIPSSHHPVAPSSPDHWAFLEEVDAPQWVDLVKEAALMGTLGNDPWFSRCHTHHEASLARSENLASVSGSHGSSKEKPTRVPQPTTKKGAAEKGGGGRGSVSKLIKPSLKTNVVTACLGGGAQRVSNGGSNARGRLSPRPRLSTSLSRSKPLKKVNLIHRPGGPLLQQQKKAGSDLRVAQSESLPSVVGTSKKSSIDVKVNVPDSLRRGDPVLNNVREAAAQKIIGRSGGGGRARRGNAPGSIGGESDNTSLNGIESAALIPLFKLPPPLGQGNGDISQTDLVVVKSSPSDMNFSSDASARHSISSQESVTRALSSSAAEEARFKILAEGRRSTKGRSNEALEIPYIIPQSAEISDVRMNEPHLESTSFKGDDVANVISSITDGLEWSHEEEPEPAAQQRKSLGSPMRVKLAEKMGSSTVQKKKSNNQDGAASGEKSAGSQATHPILEKLRKSWGSALRVKQRHDAEASLSDSRSDTSGDNSVDVKIVVGRSAVTTRKKWDLSQVQSEVLQRAQAASTAQPPSDRELLIRNIISRERRAAITQQHQQLLQAQPPQQLQLITDNAVIVSPSRTSFSQNSSNSSSSHLEVSNPTTNDIIATDHRKTHNSVPAVPAVTGAPNAAAKLGLAKIQANYQRSKSDMPSKFKKQYAYAETGIGKSLSMQRGNKENLQLEVKSPSPPTGFAWKRKPAVPTRRQLSPRSPGTAVIGVRNANHHHPQAVARTTSAAAAPPTVAAPPTAGISPPSRIPVGSSRSGPLFTSMISTGSQTAAEAFRPRSQVLERKVSNLAVLRGSSTSSVLKLTKQKSEKISSTSVKEANANVQAVKTWRNGAQVADESVLTGSEDRKSRPVLKYEPRLHSAKAIKEWERTSGKRYYDLPPIERQKVNQEISATVAAAGAALKAVEKKRTSA